jgi:predicted RNA-binding protein with PUA-like domain
MRPAAHGGHLFKPECNASMANVAAPKLSAVCWLMKSEPDEASVEHFIVAPRQTLPWTGVRNYQARNMLRDAMQIGDPVLFYHSSCAEPGIVGVARIAGPALPDETQFDPNSPYFDPKASRESPRWVQRDVQVLQQTRLLPLTEMRVQPSLASLRVLQRGNRLSITPVTPHEHQAVLALLGVRAAS